MRSSNRLPKKRPLHVLQLTVLTSAQWVSGEGSGGLNDPIKIDRNDQVIITLVVAVVVAAILAIILFCYLRHRCSQRRFREELRERQNNDNTLQLCEVAAPVFPRHVDSRNNASQDPRPPPPAYATAPCPPPYARNPAAVNSSCGRKEGSLGLPSVIGAS